MGEAGVEAEDEVEAVARSVAEAVAVILPSIEPGRHLFSWYASGAIR